MLFGRDDLNLVLEPIVVAAQFIIVRQKVAIKLPCKTDENSSEED